jgi:putative phage-type endonuclease
MGVSRWRSPLALWAEKTGKLTPNPLENAEAKEIGLELEEYVCRKFERRTGKKVRREPRELVHPRYPFLKAHLDRIVLNEESVLEAKTASAWLMKVWEGHLIPIDYTLQVNWQLGLSGRKLGYIAVLIGGQKFLYKELPFDQALFNEQVEKAVTFWNSFVQTGIAPMAIAQDQDLLFQLFPESGSAALILEDDEAKRMDFLIAAREVHRLAIEVEQEKLDEVEVRIKQAIGDAAGLLTQKYRVSWITQQCRRLDTNKIKADGLYDKYALASMSRVFRVKPIGEGNGRES